MNKSWQVIQEWLDKALSNGLYQPQPAIRDFFAQLEFAANQKSISSLAQAAEPLAKQESTLDERIESWLKIAALCRAMRAAELRSNISNPSGVPPV